MPLHSRDAALLTAAFYNSMVLGWIVEMEPLCPNGHHACINDGKLTCGDNADLAGYAQEANIAQCLDGSWKWKR